MKSLKPLQLAVCCLNISEGRSQNIIESIADAAVSNQDRWTEDKNVATTEGRYVDLKCKGTVLSVYMDAVFNRGNITLAAPVEYLSTCVIQACTAAFEIIDLECHLNPGHPRLGVVDLIPIHPVSSNVTLETCGGIATRVAQHLASEIKGTGFFLFGSADKDNRGLIQRRKEMDWFSRFDIKCTPDIGEYNSKYGIAGIGAAPYMSVMNILLDTTDLSIGRDIASIVRGSNRETGLPGIQAMAFLKDSAVEIACNVDTNSLQGNAPVFSTTFEELERAISTLAQERHVDIIGESLKGFTPDKAYKLASEALLTGSMSPWRERGVAVM